MAEHSTSDAVSLLQVSGLSKRYGDSLVVDDVSFDVASGGSLALVGESGSGKTTIAKMIVGLVTPTAGTITACGHDRSRHSTSTEVRRRRGSEIQIVFQDPYSSLDPRQSGFNAIDEVLRLHRGGSKDDRARRVDELGSMVGLDTRQLHALPRGLSGGQRQRVAIARALAAEPQLLILDESVAALDVSIQAQVLNLLCDIRDQTNISYLLISHDLAVVRQITDDVIVLHRGTGGRARCHRGSARRPARRVHAPAAGQRASRRLAAVPACQPCSFRSVSCRPCSCKQGDVMNDSELCFLSANEVLTLYRAKELSPVELLDALIERIEAIEPQINAVCDRRYDEARAEAAASADRYAGKGDAPRALEGVPVAAKEEQPMVGRINSYGSLVYADQVATATHPMLERIQAAGGIIHIRATTPEFSCAGFTHSRLWGITRNPWNTEYTPGGSSGGSGAALAAGYAPLATGSDIGGSIRIPASFCGVVGFKPPFGRVPAMPPFNLDQYCHDGPMARTVADAALLTNVVAGRHPDDIVSMPAPPHLPLESGSIGELRIALCINLGDHQVDPLVEANTRRAAAVFESLGATVVEVELPWTFDQVYAAARAHFGGIFGPSVAKDLEAHGDLLTTYASAFARDMADVDQLHRRPRPRRRALPTVGCAAARVRRVDLPDHGDDGIDRRQRLRRHRSSN